MISFFGLCYVGFNFHQPSLPLFRSVIWSIYPSEPNQLPLLLPRLMSWYVGLIYCILALPSDYFRGTTAHIVMSPSIDWTHLTDLYFWKLLWAHWYHMRNIQNYIESMNDKLNKLINVAWFMLNWVIYFLCVAIIFAPLHIIVLSFVSKDLLIYFETKTREGEPYSLPRSSQWLWLG